MSEKKKLSIIIPVYNNEASLEALLDKILIEEKKLQEKISFEIIFVNDCSKDKSLDELKRIKNKKKNVIIINLNKNYGSNLAAKTGLKLSTGDAHTILSADLQEPPALITEMVEKWLMGEKMIITERNSRRDPLLKIILANIFYFFFRLIINKDYPKNGFDLFLIDKKITMHLKNSDRDLYMPIHLIDLGFSYSVIKYDRQERYSGKSQWTFKKNFNATFEIFSIYSSTLISKIILIFGFFIFLIAAIYSLVLGYLALFEGYKANGFVTLFLYITIFFGISTSLLGIVVNQIFLILNRVSRTDETIYEIIDNK